MNKYKYNIGLVLLLFFFGSCNDFLDVNTDPTQINEEKATLATLLPGVIERTSLSHYQTAIKANQVTHHLDNITSEYYNEFSMSGAWSTIYLRGLENAETIIRKAELEGSYHYTGVAQVLKAVNLGLLTDCWENVPFSEATQGSLASTPKYDTQEDVYAGIQSILDEAIANLNQESSFRSPGGDDLVYAGEMSNWIKLAHSLKARYMLHLFGKSDNSDAILSELEQGFSSNDDDFKLVYNGTITNPWYFNIAKKINESIYSYNYSHHLISTMNGDYNTVVDPRLSMIADLGDNTEFIGLKSYGDDKHDATIQPSESTFYFAPNAPIVMMTYSEAMFIKAEVLNNKGSDATDAYNNGIKAHMTMLSVDTETQDAYITNPNVSNASLKNIMKEKYIALMLNTETWNDMRRHNFDATIYSNFVEPNLEGRDQPAQRAVYPASEESRNLENFQANLKPLTEKMWKDQ